MVPLLNHVYVHCYVDTAAQAYPFGAQRFGYFATANNNLGTHTKVLPIFSAEDTQYSAGGEYFMGEWLRDNCLPAAENQFYRDFEAANWGTKLQIGGVVYYDYYFTSKYVNGTCPSL